MLFFGSILKFVKNIGPVEDSIYDSKLKVLIVSQAATLAIEDY